MNRLSSTVVAGVAGMLVCGGCGASGQPPVQKPYMVDGIRLVRAPPPVHDACVAAARRLGAVVYCPTRVPPKWGTQMLICNDCNGTFSLTGSFPAPHGYVGPPGEVGVGHFTVWASTMKYIRDGYVGCTEGQTLRHERIVGRETTWMFCPPGSALDSGHVLMEWSQGEWIYALSLHSNTATNRRLLQIMAENVIEVR